MRSNAGDDASEPNRLTQRGGDGNLEPIDRERWYVVLDAELHGPISRRALARLLAEHPSDVETPLWSDACTDEWTTVHDVPGLADEVAACRATRTGVTVPSAPVMFASSSEPSPMVPASASGEVNIGAALRALAATAQFVTGKKNAAAQPVAASARRSRRSDWTVLASGVVLGGAIAFVAIDASRQRGHTADETSRPTISRSVVVADAPAPSAPRLAVAGPPLAPSTEPHGPATPVVVPPIVRADDGSAVAHYRGATRVARGAARGATAHARAETTDQETDELDELDELDDEPEDPGDEATVEPDEPATPQAPEEHPRARSIEELIIAAVPTEPAPTPARAETPVTRTAPTDAEVVRALDGVRAAVVACTPVHAVAALRVTVDGTTGRVTSVNVDGVFGGTPVGSCIAQAVRRARVAPFSEPSFTLSYPYRL